MFFSEYGTFAEVKLDDNGIRQLISNGNKFIEYYIDLRSQETFWSCTTPTYNSITKKKTPCRACIKTKLIDGYEMIRNPNPKHDH